MKSDGNDFEHDSTPMCHTYVTHSSAFIRQIETNHNSSAYFEKNHHVKYMQRSHHVHTNLTLFRTFIQIRHICNTGWKTIFTAFFFI